jgi:hypothetical protein
MSKTASLQKADNMIESAKRPTFLFTMGITYLTYIFLFLGISYILPSYIRAISNFMHVVICLFLIYKFNPLRTNQQLTEYDNYFIFFASVFILMSMGLTEFSLAFFKTLRNIMKVDLTATTA